MADTRKKNTYWWIKTDGNGSTPIDNAHLAVLMDLGDELQTLVSIFRCHNAQAIPGLLRRIARNTAKKRKPKTTKKRK